MTPESHLPPRTPRALDGPHRRRHTPAPSPWTDHIAPELGTQPPRISLRRRGCAPSGPLTKEDWALRFKFATLVLYTRESLTEGLKPIEWDLLGFALLGTAIDVQDHILSCLEPSIHEVVRVFMGHLTGIPEREVSVAQRLVLDQLLEGLEERSDLTLNSH